MKRLVVVESPTKAKTIRHFLSSPDYQIEACFGHVRDLPANASEIPEKYKSKPWGNLGVDVSADYQPIYIVPSSKSKVVAKLKQALKEADELIIATDEDREGESIGWHLTEVLKPRVPIHRMVFHEITQEAILEALENTRDIDRNLVDAQETRRVLDRLVGYVISPLLWRKIAPKLSAGRVQSVAVRLLVIRERERMAFVAGSYWDIKAVLDEKGRQFDAAMTHLDGIRLASGRDFDETTGRLAEGSNVLLLSEEKARDLADRLPGTPWRVLSVEDKQTIRRPYPPFITSTLQQEANRKLGLSARDTMRIAQKLYEEGHITYMRTDSTHLSNEAVAASRRAVEQRYGRDYLSPKSRHYGANRESAQEAHEAIRPAGTGMKTAEELRIGGREAALYDLIWKRTVAAQMADARLTITTAIIESGNEDTGRARFRASGRRLDFAGFFRAYVEGSDDPEAALEDRESLLPPLHEGDTPHPRSVEPVGHETKPPARYTEATLVKQLEEKGIGRPSTYASILGTIVDRGYVRKQGPSLVPTFTAFATTQLLEEQFEELVDIGFTAEMERVLDEIAAGGTASLPYLRSLYEGERGVASRVEAGLDLVDARAVSTIAVAKWEPFKVRVGRYGPYVVRRDNGEESTAPVPEDVAPADMDRESLESLFDMKLREDFELGIDPVTRLPVYLKKGRFGPYVQLGPDDNGTKPKRSSLPKGLTPDTIDLEQALQLLALPRPLGTHPETGQVVVAGLGRFGPFVQHDKVYASLKAGDDVLTVDLARALELFREKKSRTGGAALRTLGTHPDTGKSVDVYEGRFGPYVKHEKVNASLPKGSDPQATTLEEALDLLAAKSASGRPAGRRKPSAKTTKKPTKKESAKGTGASKATVKASTKAGAKAKPVRRAGGRETS